MNKLVKICICFIVLTLGLSLNVKADMGPKPTLKIIVSNPPKEEYYLDLLVDYPTENTNSWLDEEIYDKNKLQILREYRDGNWRSAHLTGTYAPISGGLIGEQQGNKMIHEFGYVGLPKKFRIVILTKDNEIIVSKEVEKKTFDEVIYYDFETNKVTENSTFFSYAKQFSYTCFFTLLIEGITLICFGFSLKKNYKPFLLINLATQIFLNMVLSIAMIKIGLIGALVFYIPAELLILASEIVFFMKYLTPQNKGKIVIYTLTANFISFFIGLMLMRSTLYIPF